jgi:hypothetical protein
LDGRLVGCRHRIVGQSIMTSTALGAFRVNNGIDQTSVEGATVAVRTSRFPPRGEDYAGLEAIGDKIRLNSSSLDSPVVILHDQMGHRSC